MNCLFCKILNNEIPAVKVFENDNILAFRDINPVAEEHILFIPKKHISSLNEIEKGDAGLMGELLHTIASYARENGFNKNGYRVVNNMGENAGQTVFHIHFHLLAGRSFRWPPG